MIFSQVQQNQVDGPHGPWDGIGYHYVLAGWVDDQLTCRQLLQALGEEGVLRAVDCPGCHVTSGPLRARRGHRLDQGGTSHSQFPQSQGQWTVAAGVTGGS